MNELIYQPLSPVRLGLVGPECVHEAVTAHDDLAVVAVQEPVVHLWGWGVRVRVRMGCEGVCVRVCLRAGCVGV